MEQQQEQEIVQSLVPYASDMKKSRYLSFRACGFTVYEAARLSGVKHGTVQQWHTNDQEFKRLDDAGITELRQNVAARFVTAEFLRNYRLVLQRDFEVLQKAALDPDNLTQPDHLYLGKIRPQYSPQQLEIMKRILQNEPEKQYNFTDFIIQIRNERIQNGEKNAIQSEVVQLQAKHTESTGKPNRTEAESIQ